MMDPMMEYHFKKSGILWDSSGKLKEGHGFYDGSLASFFYFSSICISNKFLSSGTDRPMRLGRLLLVDWVTFLYLHSVTQSFEYETYGLHLIMVLISCLASVGVCLIFLAVNLLALSGIARASSWQNKYPERFVNAKIFMTFLA